MKKINLSPSFLSKVYDRGYDYAVGEKIGMFPKVDTNAMSDGRLMHAMIAERIGGEETKIVISPFDNFRTKEARFWRDAQPSGTFVVSQNRFEELSQIANRVINHESLLPYLSTTTVTEKIYEKEVNGLNVKGVLDLVSTNADSVSVIDWKFVSSLVFDDFPKKALRQNYDLQASVYDYLVNPTHVFFCVIENEIPHRIKLYHCDESFLLSGSTKFDKAVKILIKEDWREPNFDIKDVDELMDWNSLL